jgi:hypothetical protein
MDDREIRIYSTHPFAPDNHHWLNFEQAAVEDPELLSPLHERSEIDGLRDRQVLSIGAHDDIRGRARNIAMVEVDVDFIDDLPAEPLLHLVSRTSGHYQFFARWRPFSFRFCVPLSRTSDVKSNESKNQLLTFNID